MARRTEVKNGKQITLWIERDVLEMLDEITDKVAMNYVGQRTINDRSRLIRKILSDYCNAYLAAEKEKANASRGLE